MTQETTVEEEECPGCGFEGFAPWIYCPGCNYRERTEEDTSEPHIRLGIDLFHDARNQNATVERVEGRIELLSKSSVESVRIAVGHEASGVYVKMVGKWYKRDLERIVSSVVRELDGYYADNVKVREWFIEIEEDNDN